MAEIDHTGGNPGHMMAVFVWEGVGEGDSFAPVEIQRLPYAYSVQVTGTFGSATVSLHGSLDGAAYFPLKDRNDEDIAIETDGIATARDFVRFIKPVAAGGTGQDIDAVLLVGFQP